MFVASVKYITNNWPDSIICTVQEDIRLDEKGVKLVRLLLLQAQYSVVGA